METAPNNGEVEFHVEKDNNIIKVRQTDIKKIISY